MVLRWCDPVLVAAVQAAETPFTEGQVLAACPCCLGGASPAVPDPPDLDPGAIVRIQASFASPWNALVADLRSRIMISRIVLTGTPAADPGTMPVSIPPSYVNQYEFDFRTDAVSWIRGAWRSVTATLTTEAAATDNSGEAPLPLKQAMLTWCDDALVDRYETAGMADRLAAEIRACRLHPDRERRYAGISMFDIDCVEQPWKNRFRPAQVEVLVDFRARLASGALELHGLQIEPVLATERGLLSAAWAERMHFDWQKQTVRVDGALFVDVLGMKFKAVAAAEPPAAIASRKRGRPKYPKAELVAIVRTRTGKRASTNEREADDLLREFLQRYPSMKPPAARTIEEHVDDIYAAAYAKAGPLKPVK